MILIVIIIFGIAIEEVLDFCYKRTNAYLIEKDETNKFHEVPNNISICNLGSSHARYALSYEENKDVGFNFAVSPQSLRYDYSILKMYHKKLNRGCVVMIFIPPCVFFLNRYYHIQSNYKYYYFLNKEYIDGYNSLIKFLFLRRPLMIMPWKVKYIIKDVDPLSVDLDVNCDIEYNRQVEARNRILGWNEEFGLLKCDKNEIPPEFEETSNTLKEIVDYCIKKEFRPVLVIPPVSMALHKEFERYNLDVNWMLYNQLTENIIEKAPLFDYFSTLEFKDNRFYSNADFLNEEGRKCFSQTLFDDIANKLGEH